MRTFLACIALAASTCNAVPGSQSGELAFETGSEAADAGPRDADALARPAREPAKRDLSER